LLSINAGADGRRDGGGSSSTAASLTPRAVFGFSALSDGRSTRGSLSPQVRQKVSLSSLVALQFSQTSTT
jgi:hypothetical protein